MSTDLAVEIWQMWTWAPVSSASMASRITMISSAMAGRPSIHSWRDTLPLVQSPVAHHGGVLTVAQNGQLQPFGVDQGVPHQVGVVHVAAVVGEGHGPRPLQGVSIGELLAPQAHGHRADGVDVDAAGLGGPLPDILYLLRTVHHRLGVGHTGHCCDAAPGQRRRRRRGCPLYRSDPDPAGGRACPPARGRPPDRWRQSPGRPPPGCSAPAGAPVRFRCTSPKWIPYR